MGAAVATTKFLHETPIAELDETVESDAETFLNEEAWPEIVDFLADIGVELSDEYKIRFIDEEDGIEAAGEAGALMDEFNGEKAIRVNPDTMWTVLPHLAHEGAHKYLNELVQPAKDLMQEYSVLNDIHMYLEAATADDFQFSSLAYQAPERLETIAELAEAENEKWREESARHPEDSEEYDDAVEKQYKTSELLRQAMEREMELHDIDQEPYDDANYEEGFTTAVMLFAASGLDRDGWDAFLESDHPYAEGETAEIIEKVYERAQSAKGTDRERMRAALSLQEEVYQNGKNILS